MTEAHGALFGFMDMLYGREPDESEEQESDGFRDVDAADEESEENEEEDGTE